MLITYRTQGVCSREIVFNIEKRVVANVDFKDGCTGNLQAISRLVEGMPVEDVIRKLRGIDCDGKGTSCPDQLSRALERALKDGKESIA